MQETWDFIIKDQIHEDNDEDLIREILCNEKKDLGIFLSYYYKKDGAVAENVKLKDQIVYLEKGKGKFLVEFDLIYHNACLNIHEEDRENLEVNFEIDRNSKTLKLIGPFWPERELDDI